MELLQSKTCGSVTVPGKPSREASSEVCSFPCGNLGNPLGMDWLNPGGVMEPEESSVRSVLYQMKKTRHTAQRLPYAFWEGPPPTQ